MRGRELKRESLGKERLNLGRLRKFELESYTERES